MYNGTGMFLLTGIYNQPNYLTQAQQAIEHTF